MFQDIKKENFAGVDFQFYVKLISLIRSRVLNFLPEKPKYFDMNSVAMIAPIVDLLNHSFTVFNYKYKNNFYWNKQNKKHQPNCKIEGLYIQNDSESFIVVRSMKDIKKDEELTLNYGNFSNKDLLMRFGFIV